MVFVWYRRSLLTSFNKRVLSEEAEQDLRRVDKTSENTTYPALTSWDIFSDANLHLGVSLSSG
jgi:hypothetical protein